MAKEINKSKSALQFWSQKRGSIDSMTCGLRLASPQEIEDDLVNVLKIFGISYP